MVWLLTVIFVILVGVDFFTTPAPRGFEVDRSVPERVGLGQVFIRSIKLAHPSAAGRLVELDEEFARDLDVVFRTQPDEYARGAPVRSEPIDLDSGDGADTAAGNPSGGPCRARCSPRGEVCLERGYIAQRRGVLGLGDLRLRVHGSLGLVWRSGRLFGEQSIAVDSALSGLKRVLRLAASERWDELGLRLRVPRKGETEFESLRDYVPGDDPRTIDWKAFARHSHPIVREYQPEQGQELMLLVDCGRRMGVTTAVGAERAWTKLDFALDAALELAAVALERGDRVGLAAFDSEVIAFQPPRRGRRQFARLREAVFGLLPTERDTDLGRVVQELEARRLRHPMLVVLSDVADPFSIERQRRVLARAASRWKTVFASLDDPALRRVAGGEAQALASERSAAFRVLDERKTSLGVLSRSGARVLDSLPSEVGGKTLVAWLEERRAS